MKLDDLPPKQNSEVSVNISNIKLSHILLSTSLIALGTAVPTIASAQVLSGTVTDASGQAPFEGAIITLGETGRQTSTNRFGEYRFSNIAPGTYSVRTSYIGTDDVLNTVTVPAAGTELNITLGSDVDYINNIIVVGTRAAQANALNQQRAADSIKTIIDSDGLGNFPDTTVADSLQRAAGISIETDQGEGRYVSIRGLNTDLISSSINGVRTPSPEDRRGVMLDGVPSDLLDGIEVQKSLTPDVDADSLGGVINLKTTSAFDRKDNYARAKLEGTYNEISESLSPKGTLTLSDTWNDTLGAAVSLSYQNLNIESHNNEIAEWGFDDDTGRIIPNDDYEQRWYDIQRERIGLVANVDWRVNESTDLYLRTLFNRYEDDEDRNKFEVREFDEEIIAADANSVSIRRGEVDAEVRQRKEIREIQTYSVGGKTLTGLWTFEYQGSYAFATEDDSDNHDARFRSGPEQRDSDVGSVTLDYSNPQQPVLSGQALGFLQDASNYQLDSFEIEDTINEDTEYALQLDIARESVIGNMPVEWKVGAKYRDRNKFRDQNFSFFEPDEDVELIDFIDSNAEITNWRLANRMFRWPDADLTQTLIGSFTDDEFIDDDSLLESSVGDFEIDETILAGYGMGTFELGDTTIIAGVRVEATDTDLQGNIFDVEEETVTSREVSNDYTDILPSLNIRHNLTEKLVGRAAYYAAIVRPSFGEVAPRAIINLEDEEVIDPVTGDEIEVEFFEAEIGNPDLKPYSANNFDLSLEYYPTNLSVFSVGVFYKDISDAIFSTRINDDVTVAGLVPDSLDLFFLPDNVLSDLRRVDTFINVDKTEVYGIEFNVVQNLGDLNDSLDGFLVSGNLTLTDSKATLPNGREVPFLKQANTVANAQIGYDKGKWDLRLSANYRSEYLDDLVGENFDRYTDERLLVSASAKYKFSKQLQLYVEGKNLLDEPEYYYFGDKSRLSQYDEFGSSFVFGARFTY